MNQTDYDKAIESERKKEDWMNSKWRPMMGWTYMLTCVADFVIFPILWSLLQSISKGQVNIQWQPITLQGAGLFHIAMGAVLGIAAYGRTQEKMSGANNGGIPLPANIGTTYTPPPPVGQAHQPHFSGPVSTTVMQTYGNPQPTTRVGSFSGGFNQTSLMGDAFIGGQIVSGYRGKPGPMQPSEPEI